MKKIRADILVPIITGFFSEIGAEIFHWLMNSGSAIDYTPFYYGCLVMIGLMFLLVIFFAFRKTPSNYMNLLNMPIFETMMGWRTYMHKEFSLDNKFRQEIFSCILSNLLACYSKHLKYFTNIYQKNQKSPVNGKEVYSNFHGAINSLVLEMDSLPDCLNKTLKDYTAKDRDSYIVAVNFFMTWHDNFKETYLKQAEGICLDNEVYETNNKKVWTALKMVEGFINVMYTDIGKVVSSLNSKLDPFTLHGKVIGH